MSIINLFENVNEDVINKTLQNIKVNLSRISADERNGHAYQKHANKDDDYLQNRILSGKKAATSYYDKTIAKEVTLSAIKKHWDDVEWFLISNLSELEIKYKRPEMGYGYLQGVEGVFEDCYLAIIILQKDPNVPWGFYVKTSYPIITYDMTPESIA